MSSAIMANNIFWADVPDPDVIRVGSVFYMVSTSMHSMPGCPIMKSVNLRDWEIVNYVFDIFEDNESHRLLDGTGIYGKGSWAATLRYKNGIYYVGFSSNDMNLFYIYRTKDIEGGEWERSVIPGLHHDPSILFDDDGRVYVIHGNGNIQITELTEDATALKQDGIDRLLLEGERDGINLRIEGCHAYKINGYYYLFFIEWPRDGNERRRQLCYRSQKLLGSYERKIILDEDLGYHNKGVAQGGIFDTEDRDWYTVLFQDHDAVGRIPYLLPVTWENDWPILGSNGRPSQGFEQKLPISAPQSLVKSDEFDYDQNKLALHWQWNHNPDNQLWSVIERPGWMRLYTGALIDTLLQARNTLTQRTEGPACSAEVLLDLSHLKPGDRAGLVALQNGYGSVGIEAEENGSFSVVMNVNEGNGLPETIESLSFSGEIIYLKIHFNFEESLDQAYFFYSEDGAVWKSIGQPLQMKYTLDHFMGYRIGLFNYATQQNGGHADFDYFRYTSVRESGVSGASTRGVNHEG